MPSPTAVVIVNFNAGLALTNCVRSVLASSVPVELSVVDNGSSDGSVALLRESVPAEPRLQIIENGDNRGFARANNQVLRHTRTDYVLLLNPDAVLRPDTLERVRQAAEERPRVGLTGCLILNPDGTEQAGCRRAVPTPWRAFVRAFDLARLLPYHRKLFDDYVLAHEPLPAAPIELEAISGAFMLVRRAALRDVGLLDEGYFLHCEDLDWCMRFRQLGWSVLFVPDATIVHEKGRCGRDRPVRVLFHMHRGMVRFYRKFFRHQYPAPLMWAVIAGVWVRFGALACRAAISRLRGRSE